MDWTTSTLTAADGVELALYQAGPVDEPVDAPVVLLVHGYPDDHTVWNSVAGQLAERFRVLAYDVRGAGASTPPAGRAGYRIEQLADDLDTVAATAGRPVHLLAHDWGSVQAWHAVTRPDAEHRYASFTSVSGPSLAYTGAWYRAHRQANRSAVLRQLAASWYVAFFLLPALPEWAWRRGLLQRMPAVRRRPPVTDDAVHGLEMYRANVRGNARAALAPRRCEVPTLVLIPEDDPFITPACARESPHGWVRRLRTQSVDGDHWGFVTAPNRVSTPFAAFVDELGSWNTDPRA